MKKTQENTSGKTHNRTTQENQHSEKYRKNTLEKHGKK